MATYRLVLKIDSLFFWLVKYMYALTNQEINKESWANTSLKTLAVVEINWIIHSVQYFLSLKPLKDIEMIDCS